MHNVSCVKRELASSKQPEIKPSMNLRMVSPQVARSVGGLWCKNEEEIPVIIEKIKQQITAKSQRIRRYEKRSKQFRQNKLFKDNAKQFYREIGKKQYFQIKVS